MNKERLCILGELLHTPELYMMYPPSSIAHIWEVYLELKEKVDNGRKRKEKF